MNTKKLLFLCAIGLASCQQQPTISEGNIVDGKVMAADGVVLGIEKDSKADKMPENTQFAKTLQSSGTGKVIDSKLIIGGKVIGRIAQD